MPIVKSPFKAAWWLSNRHLQTLWPVLLRRVPKLPLERERINLPDGDFVDLDWLGKNDAGPIIFLLHGLGGSVNSHYAGNFLAAARAQGFRCVIMHFRGCSGEPNRLQRNYHSGDTADLDFVINKLQQHEPYTSIYGVGFSMGGNVLLKYLGEKRSNPVFKAAVAVCVPLDLTIAAQQLQQGFSRVYQWHLIRDLKLYMQHKYQVRKLPELNVDWATIKTFWQFDDLVTAPLHGFRNAYDYYLKASSKAYLKNINVPTLIIHAEDDPFMNNKVLPQLNELSDHVTVEITEKGGHVGFISGKVPGLASYWLEQRLIAFLKPNC
jgi:predicted alpha/beta-fold hydrolase